MNQPEWFENFYKKLDEKKDDIEPGDIRFYNIERIPILAKKTVHFSSDCPVCLENISKLDQLIAMLPECMEIQGDRIQFEKEKNKIEKHLKINHALRFENHFTSLFTLLGLIIGIAAGLIYCYTRYGYLEQNSILISTAIGLFAGRIVGIRRDRKQNRSGLQL